MHQPGSVLVTDCDHTLAHKCHDARSSIRDISAGGQHRPCIDCLAIVHSQEACWELKKDEPLTAVDARSAVVSRPQALLPNNAYAANRPNISPLRRPLI